MLPGNDTIEADIWREFVRRLSGAQAAVVSELARSGEPELDVTQIGRATFLPRISLSTHLRALRRRGIVEARSVGRRRLYSIIDPRWLRANAAGEAAP